MRRSASLSRPSTCVERAPVGLKLTTAASSTVNHVIAHPPQGQHPDYHPGARHGNGAGCPCLYQLRCSWEFRPLSLLDFRRPQHLWYSVLMNTMSTQATPVVP